MQSAMLSPSSRHALSQAEVRGDLLTPAKAISKKSLICDESSKAQIPFDL